MIYFDHAATTRVLPEAAEAAVLHMCEQFGNPSSLHQLGLSSSLTLDRSRAVLSRVLGCDESELVFTSGGTESNNLALFGTLAAKRRRGGKVIVSHTEHPSVLECTKSVCELFGFECTFVDPLPDGSADTNEILRQVDEKTVLVSAMQVNNETGSVTDAAELCRLIKAKNSHVIFHCDGVQAFLKYPLALKRCGIDLYSISGHKIGAPKGVGALYVKKGVRLIPLLSGGAQERGFRSGTENIPGIAAFAKAAEISFPKIQENFKNASSVNAIIRLELSSIDGLTIHSPSSASPYILGFSNGRIPSEVLVSYFSERDICVSAGSACKKGKRSHTLSVMGLSSRQLDTALRISFCGDNTEEEALEFIRVLRQGLSTLHGLS